MDKLVSEEYGYVENKKELMQFNNRDEFDTLNPLWNKLYEGSKQKSSWEQRSTEHEGYYKGKTLLPEEQLQTNIALCYSLIIHAKKANERYNNSLKEIHSFQEKIMDEIVDVKDRLSKLEEEFKLK